MNTRKPLMLKELPQDERPREKMMVKGAHSLSNSELLAILLRTGTAQESVLRVAERILTQYGGLAGLTDVLPQELQKQKGIGAAKAVSIVAALELGKRMTQLGSLQRPVIRSPQDAANLLMAQLRHTRKEHFMALLLSTKNHVLANPVISVGTLDASVVHPRELFREAISHSAASVILVHNHPSGDPTPSKEDIWLTKNLIEAGKYLAIPVLDHIVIGDGKYVSFKEKGII